MTDTIESLGRELDAAELAAHGKIEGPSWPATLAEWVRNRTPLDRVAFLPYMLPFRERIRALLDATRKPRKSRAQLARKCDRLRAKVIAARMERDAAVKRYAHAEAHVRDCDARADRDREDWLALHAKYEAAMGVVEAARPFVPPGIESKPVDIGRPSGYRRLAAAIHAFDARSTSTCPFADDACAGGDPCAKPENVGTWSEELWRGKAQWRCGCGADAGNLRVYGAERCGGCAWKRPEVKGGA